MMKVKTMKQINIWQRATVRVMPALLCSLAVALRSDLQAGSGRRWSSGWPHAAEVRVGQQVGFALYVVNPALLPPRAY